MNALPLRRRITQLGYPPVDGFRHAAQLVGVGLAFLAKAPLREPLVESLGFLRSVLPVFASTAAARWSPAMPLLPLLTLRSSVWKWQLPLWSRKWSWPLSTRSLPYSECDQLTLMHGVCCIVPYRLRLCTYMLSRRILIVMRLCVGILLVLWRALFGTCLCGLRCKRWTFLVGRFRRSPHPRCDTKLHIPISRNAIPPQMYTGADSVPSPRPTGVHCAFTQLELCGSSSYFFALPSS